VTAPGTPVPVTHPTASEWKLTTHATEPQALRLRLTDVPGWHASVDGRSVPIQRFAGVMLQVVVPAGRHQVRLTYWPSRFTLGIVLAAGAAVGLLSALVLDHRRHRHRPRPGHPDVGTPPLTEASAAHDAG
jgi:uncharacterized membrane protein YfhO